MFFPLKAGTSQYVAAMLTTVCLFCSGCAAHDGRVVATLLAKREGFAPIRLANGPYVLQGWMRPGAGDTVRVYIEGDGFAWRSRSEPSTDPTPGNPVGLALAAADPSGAPVCYVARPCQYVEGEDRRGCNQNAWTSGRYDEKTLSSVNSAVNEFKARTGAAKVMLCGYSGGGALAALLAARRDDVVFWATVAGNLELEAWTSYHKLSPLVGSLDPYAERGKTAHIPQLHMVGGKDTVIPPLFARDWCEGMELCRVVEVPELSHGGPWEYVWSGILSGRFPGVEKSFRQMP